MKKIASLMLVLALTFSFATVGAAQTDAGLKLGLSVTATAAKSKDASDTDGLAQVDMDAVAVLMDADGKIVDLSIDSAQAKMPFTATGTLGADFPTEVKTKIELGTAYGMAAVSKIGDWDQQIEAFRVYVIGKTAEQIKGIALDDSTHPTDADLTAGCTMAIGDYVNGVIAAMEKAVPVNAAATDKVGLSIIVSTDKSKDSMNGDDGLAQANATFAAVTVDAQGAVTACQVDSTKLGVTFNATGKITSDLTVEAVTLQTMGEAYGMKAASAIGKEWNEQADAFAAYTLGKTAAQIDGIALDASTKPTGADLVASVTMSAGDLKTAVLKAIANVK